MTPDLPISAKGAAVAVPSVPATELHIFAKPDGAVQVQVRVENGTVWLTQKQMAAMYGVTVANIRQHLKNIFADGKLLPNSVVKNYLITALDRKTYETKHYSLDAIIHVGYRVRSDMGVLFRA